MYFFNLFHLQGFLICVRHCSFVCSCFIFFNICVYIFVLVFLTCNCFLYFCICVFEWLPTLTFQTIIGTIQYNSLATPHQGICVWHDRTSIWTQRIEGEIFQQKLARAYQILWQVHLVNCETATKFGNY